MTNALLLRGTLELLLLQALSSGPLHGYAIARLIEKETGDQLSVEEGSMYPALYRLEERGLVLAKWAKGDKGRRVRVYSLSTTGKKRLAEQQDGWLSFAKAVSRMIGAAR